MSGDHDRRTQGGRVVARPGEGGAWRMNETIPCGVGGSPMGVFFFVGSLFSPRRGHFLRLFIIIGAGAWGGGQFFWADRIAPSNKFKPPRSGDLFVCVCVM